MTTLKDIAKEAGVTITTVAAVLAGKGRISETTRDRVLKIASDLDYSPNSAARILKNKHLADIGIIIADNQTMHLQLFLKYCTENNLKYQLELYTSASPQPPALFTPGFAKGILYVGNISPDVESFIRKNPDYPIVTINERSPFCVCSNFEYGTRKAIEYLVAHGHQRIASTYTTGTSYATHGQIQKSLLECWDSIIPDHSPELKPFSLQWNTPDYFEINRKHSVSLLKLKNPPTAFFFSGIRDARALIYDALRLGFRIPEDISIIAVGYTTYAVSAFPLLSCVENDVEKTAHAAMQLLLRRIKKKKIAVPEIVLNTKLVHRETTGSPNRKAKSSGKI